MENRFFLHVTSSEKTIYAKTSPSPKRISRQSILESQTNEEINRLRASSFPNPTPRNVVLHQASFFEKEEKS